MEKHNQDGLPTYIDATSRPTKTWWRRRQPRRRSRLAGLLALLAATYFLYAIAQNTSPSSGLSIEQLEEDYASCAKLQKKPVAHSETRHKNKRWLDTTKPTLIRNATVWTGEPNKADLSEEEARDGKHWSWISSDIFVHKGLILKVERNINVKHLPKHTEVFNANGRQLTAGIVDMHSHAGLGSVANLQDDTNEMSSDITPYVRSIDGLDPLQPELEFIKSGGVTTSLFLPGSANNMGGEAFVLKFAVGNSSGRAEISQADMFADPDREWRYMKMACGENPKRVYGKIGEHGPTSRLGEAWSFRRALEHATKYVKEQDEWCATAEAIGAKNMRTHLRQELEWESLGAVLRGQVRVNTHCYTIADLEAFVRHTNEFKFRVYAFHHAHQTYLVPEILKKAWGGTPAAALFADNMYYKVEAYTASERSGAILYEQNITPTYVSDNPVLNSQHVVFEAAKAYTNGLPYHAALAGVTSAPAELLGLGHRLGKIKAGYDADIVVWDSDPLSAGATPVQVWIDGAKQFDDSIELKKPHAEPIVPDIALGRELDREDINGVIVFTGISHIHQDVHPGAEPLESSVAIVTDGSLTCVGHCRPELEALGHYRTIKLSNGYLAPPFTAFGTSLGLQEIDAARDTHDGRVPEEGITFALDGLSWGGKQLKTAFEHGVTKAISAPSYGGIDSKGISVGFNTGAKNRLQAGSMFNPEVALHYPFTLEAKSSKTPSISAAIGELTSKFLDALDEIKSNKTDAPLRARFEEEYFVKQVIQGKKPLVLSAHSADTISSIIRLKEFLESTIADLDLFKADLNFVLIGGAEAHLVAKEVAAANISVVLAPLLPHAQTWDQRRGLTGPPLTNVSTNILLDAGVLLGISVEEMWESRDLGLLAGIAYANSEGRLTIDQALDLAGGNFYEMLKIPKPEQEDWVVWEGNPLEIGGRLRGVGSAGSVSIWV